MTSAARITRRKTAVATIAAVVAALVLPVAPVVPKAYGQVASIALLSPSRPPDLPIISDRDASGDGTFRLAAWVANPPPSPVVEFEIQVGLTTQTLGPTQQVNADTWEFQWNIAGIADGNYLLRAVLFDGTTLQEAARDELTVGLRHGELDPGTAAARVEIVSPANGAQAGLFRPPGANQAANTIIDFVRTTDTTFVRPQYTLTVPGQAPEWRSCAEGSVGASANRVRCTLAAADDPAQVTGLRLVSNTTVGPSASPAFDAAADSIRVVSYVQVPTGITVTEPVTRAPGLCSTTFSASVTDQIGRPVAAANVDVHAAGPSDQLRFDTGNTTHQFSPPSPNQAPDAGPHSPPEAGFDCFLTQVSDRLQGNHRRPGIPDVKHIESTFGTNNSGTFGFALRSPDEGNTHITLWADLDDNDEREAGEPCATTAIGWGAATPPTPQPEFPGCTFGAPIGPQETPARLTLEPSQRSVPQGGTTSFVATVVGEGGAAVANEPVSWETSGVGRITFRDDTTDSAGRATVRVTSDEEGEQIVTASAPRCSTPGGCTDSSTVSWTAVQRHGRRISINFRPQGARLIVRGRVFVRTGFQQCGRRVPVRVQRRQRGRWATLRNTRTNAARRYSVNVRNRRGRYRAVARRTTKGAQNQHLCQRAVRARRR